MLLSNLFNPAFLPKTISTSNALYIYSNGTGVTYQTNWTNEVDKNPCTNPSKFSRVGTAGTAGTYGISWSGSTTNSLGTLAFDVSTESNQYYFVFRTEDCTSTTCTDDEILIVDYIKKVSSNINTITNPNLCTIPGGSPTYGFNVTMSPISISRLNTTTIPTITTEMSYRLALYVEVCNKVGFDLTVAGTTIETALLTPVVNTSGTNRGVYTTVTSTSAKTALQLTADNLVFNSTLANLQYNASSKTIVGNTTNEQYLYILAGGGATLNTLTINTGFSIATNSNLYYRFALYVVNDSFVGMSNQIDCAYLDYSNYGQITASPNAGTATASPIVVCQ